MSIYLITYIITESYHLICILFPTYLFNKLVCSFFVMMFLSWFISNVSNHLSFPKSKIMKVVFILFLWRKFIPFISFIISWNKFRMFVVNKLLSAVIIYYKILFQPFSPLVQSVHEEIVSFWHIFILLKNM